MDSPQPLYIQEFQKRIIALDVDIKDIKRVEVSGVDILLEFPNRPGKQNSLKLYAYLAKKNNKISQKEAELGLKQYGNIFRKEAKEQRGKHPGIDLLEDIASGKISAVKVDIIKHSVVETLPINKISVFQKVAKKIGTPAYIYFEEDLLKNLQVFQAIKAPYGLIIRFAMKANSSSAILRFYEKMGVHFDASTFNECVRAIKGSKIDGAKIRLTSQEVQSKENLQFLAKNGVLYTACSLLQLETYGKVLPNTTISIRFNIGIGSGWTPQTTTGGRTSPFGIYEQKEEINALLKKYKLTLTTVHLHIGSGSDPEKQKEAIRKALIFVKEYPTVTTLNMGGGYKVAGMSYEHAADISGIGREMAIALKDFQKETGRKILLEVEPGTALVAKAGYIVTTVTDTVSTGAQGEEFLKINGGMNMNARIPMYGAQHPIVLIPQTKKKRGIKEYLVFGVCCESGDVLTVRPGKPEYLDPRRMLEAQVGDLLIIGRAGAYCASMAPENYNSQQIHPEVLVRKNGELNIIRVLQPIEDVWKYERIPKDLQK